MKLIVPVLARKNISSNILFDSSTDKSIQAMFSNIAHEFERKYPGHILPEETRDWLFLNAGGWMGSMYILHASLTEYVMFFGTAIETSGNSGKS